MSSLIIVEAATVLLDSSSTLFISLAKGVAKSLQSTKFASLTSISRSLLSSSTIKSTTYFSVPIFGCIEKIISYGKLLVAVFKYTNIQVNIKIKKYYPNFSEFLSNTVILTVAQSNF